MKLNNTEGKKVVKPRDGPYIVRENLGRVGYELAAEGGEAVVSVHTNRLR